MIPNGRFTSSRYSVNIGPPARSPKYPAPLIGRKIRNSASTGARKYSRPKRYSRIHAGFSKSPNGIPHSPPPKSGLYISGDFKETGAFTPNVALSPNSNRTWMKRTTANAPTTPAAKQIAIRCITDHILFFHHIQFSFHHVQLLMVDLCH